VDECLRDARGEAGGGGTHPGRASGGARDVGDRIKGGKKGGKGVPRLGRSRIMVEGTKEEGRAGGGVLARACIQAWTANDGLIYLAQPLVKREASVLRCCVRVLCRCVPCTLFLTFPGGEKRY